MDIKKLFLELEEDVFSVHEILHHISMENEDEISKKLIPHLTFFINRQKSDHRGVRVLGRRLALKIKSEDLMEEFAFLVNHGKSINQKVKDLSQELALKSLMTQSDDQIATEINFLIGCHESSHKNVKNLSEELMLRVIDKWEPEEDISMVLFLVSCQRSGSYHVRELSRKKALSIPSAGLENAVILFITSQNEDDVHVRNLSWELTLNVSYKALLKNRGYIAQSTEFSNERVSWFAKELLARIEKGEPSFKEKGSLIRYF